jgi:hypothetical protein
LQDGLKNVSPMIIGPQNRSLPSGLDSVRSDLRLQHRTGALAQDYNGA